MDSSIFKLQTKQLVNTSFDQLVIWNLVNFDEMKRAQILVSMCLVFCHRVNENY